MLAGSSQSAQSDGAGGPGTIDDTAALGDDDLATGHKTSGRSPGRLHQIAPLLPIGPDQPRCLTGADGVATCTVGEQVPDGLLK
jgi:hypothetical protein